MLTPKILGVLKIMITAVPNDNANTGASTTQPVSITPAISPASTASATSGPLTSSLVMVPRQDGITPRYDRDADTWSFAGTAGDDKFVIIPGDITNEITPNGGSNDWIYGDDDSNKSVFSVLLKDGDHTNARLAGKSNIVTLLGEAGILNAYPSENLGEATIDNSGEGDRVLNLGYDDEVDGLVAVKTDGVVGKGPESNVDLTGDRWKTAYVHVYKKDGEIVGADKVHVYNEGGDLAKYETSDGSYFDGVFTGVRDIKSAPTEKGNRTAPAGKSNITLPHNKQSESLIFPDGITMCWKQGEARNITAAKVNADGSASYFYGDKYSVIVGKDGNILEAKNLRTGETYDFIETSPPRAVAKKDGMSLKA